MGGGNKVYEILKFSRYRRYRSAEWNILIRQLAKSSHLLRHFGDFEGSQKRSILSHRRYEKSLKIITKSSQSRSDSGDPSPIKISQLIPSCRIGTFHSTERYLWFLDDFEIPNPDLPPKILMGRGGGRFPYLAELVSASFGDTIIVTDKLSSIQDKHYFSG